MGLVSKAGDWAFKAFTAGLGVATIYLTATFSVNVYRGLAWHKEQSERLWFSAAADGADIPGSELERITKGSLPFKPMIRVHFV